MILACGAWFLILYLLSTRTWLLKAADGSGVQAEEGAARKELKEGGISMDIRTLQRRCVILRKAMGVGGLRRGSSSFTQTLPIN